MNSSEFDRQEGLQMKSPKSRLDENHNRDDVRVDENSHDGDKRPTDNGSMNTKGTLDLTLNYSSFSGDKMEKDNAPRKSNPDEKAGTISNSNNTPRSQDKTDALQKINASGIKIEDGQSTHMNVIDDPPSTTTGTGMSETSLHAYYTDNIAAACAATNDELASCVPTGGSSKEDGENNAENKRRHKRARHKGLTSSTDDKVTKRAFEQDVQQNTPESSAVSLVIAELQRENLSLVQENAALKQNVQHLSYLLERSLAAPPRGDFNALLAQAALLQQSQARPPPISHQSHLSPFLTTTPPSLVGGNSNALQHASDLQVASLLGISGENSQQEHQAQSEQRLRVASILSALGSSNNPPSSNPLTVSSVLNGTELSSLTGGQSSSLLEQLLRGGSPSISKGANSTSVVGGDVSIATMSELQRFLVDGRGNASLGGSLNNSHNSSRQGGVTTEPVGATNTAMFSSTLQSITTSAPPPQGLPSISVPSNRGTASAQSQSKRKKHRTKHP